MKQKFVLLVVGLVFIISGCAVPGPAFKKLTEIPNKKGVVYFYRPSTFPWGAAGQATIYEDDEEHPIIKLRAGRYYPYITNARTHTYFVEMETKSEVSIDVKAGQEYFIQEKIETEWGMWFSVI